MLENKLNLLEKVSSDFNNLVDFCKLNSLDEMYEYSKKQVKDLKEEEFISLLLICIRELQRNSLKNLTEEDLKIINAGSFKVHSKIFSSFILPFIFSSSISSTNLSQDVFRNGNNINVYKKDSNISLFNSINDKSFCNTLITIGKCVMPLSILMVSSTAYKNSDNFFQRKVIGDISSLQMVKESSFNHKMKDQELIVDGNLKGKVYTPNSDIDSQLKGKTVIFYSGSGRSNSYYIQDLAKWYTSMGARVIGVDYTGFGNSSPKSSSGEIRQKNIYHDAQKIYDHVKNNLNTSPSDIIIHGFSLGGPVAAHVAANVSERNDKLCGLILQSSMKNTVNAANNSLKEENILLRLVGSVGAYLFADQFDCEKELNRIFKANPNLAISICGGDRSDGLNLINTKLDKIAEKIGFNHLTTFSGDESHINGKCSAPKNNVDLPKEVKNRK